MAFTSVCTIDSSDNDLQETYLSNVGFPGDSWVTQNLSRNYNTPAADPPGSVMYSPSSGSEGWGTPG